MILSTPAFLVASLACALGIIALVKAIDLLILPPVSTLHRRWLERRLRRRLERGDDRYFEELRSIETALQKPEAAPRPMTNAVRLVQGISVVIFGAIILAWVVPTGARPNWTDILPQSVFMLIGLQWASGLSSFDGRPSRRNRLIGVAMIVIFGFFLCLDISRLH
ncbi:hypothetical protein [Sphingomonas sp.]|uniref:hypothetical protein n=1 Tax=Sphingomonas sp. TaxID=28214 RepID=UPI003D6C9006